MQNQVSVQPWRNAAVFVGPMDVTYTYDRLHQLKSMTSKYRPHVAYGYQSSDTYVYDEIGNMDRKAQSQDRLVWDNQNVTPTTNPTQAMAQLDGSRFGHNVTALTHTLGYAYGNGRPHATSTVTETLPSSGASPRAFSYDANGNNTGNTFRGTTRTQIWDEESRLKEVRSGGAMTARFRYDDRGERRKKQTSMGDSWYVNQYYVLQPNNLPTKHIFAGETRLVSKTDAIWMQTPAVSHYHPDHLGTTSYTSAANQDLLQHERYFAFGEPWRPGAEQEETDQGRPDNLRREWLFTSKEWDVDTSLYYFGARYYDPRTGVWQSPDPILDRYMHGGPSGGVFTPRNLNLYSYTWNNPIVLRDPQGMCVATGSSGPCDAARVTQQQEGTADRARAAEVRAKTTEPGLIHEDPFMDAAALIAGGQAVVKVAGSVAKGVRAGKAAAAATEGAASREVVAAGGAGATKGALNREASNLQKQLASEAQVAEVMSGRGAAMAGAGARKPIDDIRRLTSQYGGSASDWAKIRSSNVRVSDGVSVETHACQNVRTGEIVELKTKFQ